MGVDHKVGRLDANTTIPYASHLRRRECRRCNQDFRVKDMINVGGSDDRWYCKTCYNPPKGEGPHKQGDRP
jgi:hypothetical protein